MPSGIYNHIRRKNQSHTPEWGAWYQMKHRCYNPKYIGFKLYGGRGIKVSNRWLNSFDNFLEDMGERPSDNHSLDRINNNKGYSKENCRWATKKEQQNNLRNNITYKGESNKEASLRLGGNKDLVRLRFYKGMSLKEAFNRTLKRKVVYAKRTTN